MPTAMPDEPLASRFGNAAGSTTGSSLACRRRSGGTRPCPRRCLRAAPAPPRVSAALGVAHGRRVIAVDVAEVALAVDQRVAHGEVLREPHQRVVDRLVAVRVEVAHHLADDLGALLVAAGRIEPQFAHGIEDAPVYRLQAVAHVGQRAVHDRRQRVREVALFQRILAAGRARCRPGRAESVCRSWRWASAEP